MRLIIRRWLFTFAVILIAAFAIIQIRQMVLAEQSGSSPESNSTSKLKTISTAIAALSYGSTAAGSWGDWGAMWNRVYSAATTGVNDFSAQGGTKNGTGGVIGAHDCVTTFGLDCYTKALGGVDDYNNNGTIPTDTYKKTWTTCNSGNTYCGTGRSVLNGLVSQDPNTNLVWSPRISSSSNWFVANNGKYPNGLPGDDGVCNTNGEVACYDVPHTGTGGDTKTGCAAYDDGLWRLPYQKELMQAYIDGSWGNLATANAGYWSSTTESDYTSNAWNTYLVLGNTSNGTKTANYSVRCVR